MCPWKPEITNFCCSATAGPPLLAAAEPGGAGGAVDGAVGGGPGARQSAHAQGESAGAGRCVAPCGELISWRVMCRGCAAAALQNRCCPATHVLASPLAWRFVRYNHRLRSTADGVKPRALAKSAIQREEDLHLTPLPAIVPNRCRCRVPK